MSARPLLLPVAVALVVGSGVDWPFLGSPCTRPEPCMLLPMPPDERSIVGKSLFFGSVPKTSAERAGTCREGTVNERSRGEVKGWRTPIECCARALVGEGRPVG